MKHLLCILFILFAAFAQAQHKITAILPLSGEHAAMGKNMLNAMNMALLDLKASHFEIVPVDSELPESDLLLKLTASDSSAILGPVFAKDARKLMPILSSLNTCVISFSNDRELANHECLMLLGFMPEESVTKVVGYAASYGYTINALLPEGKYGQVLASSLHFMNDKEQIKLGEIVFYDTNIDPKQIAKFNSPSNALLIPENQILPQVLPHLSQVKILGSSQFEDEKILKTPGAQGSWFASAPRKYRDRLDARFLAKFGTQPLKISVLAYDAVAFSYSAIMANNGKLDKNYLANKLGFFGVTGAFRFMADGSNQRQLSVFQINNNNQSEIEPAKADFN